LLGGGHSHLEVLKHFGLASPRDVHLTLISRSVVTPYSGMLPGMIAGHYSAEAAHVNLTPLAQFAGASTIYAEATGLDLTGRQVLFNGHPPVPYDLLSLDIGSTPSLSTPGATEHAVPVKPIDRLVRRWSRLCERVRTGQEQQVLAVVGAGAAGVEIVLSAQTRLQELLGRNREHAGRIACHLFTDSADVLPTHSAAVRRIFRRVLAERGITTHVGQAVIEVQQGRLRTADGTWHAANEMVWSTEAAAAPWLGESGLAVDSHGFVSVSGTLQSLSHAGVFASGDIASVVDHPRERSGALAVQQGPWLAANLLRTLRGQPLESYRPPRRFLSVISTGNQYAVASYGPFAFEGAWIWRWKDRAHTRFIQSYTNLPPNPEKTS
jgi:selenide,water dikinase